MRYGFEGDRRQRVVNALLVSRISRRQEGLCFILLNVAMSSSAYVPLTSAVCRFEFTKRPESGRLPQMMLRLLTDHLEWHSSYKS